MKKRSSCTKKKINGGGKKNKRGRIQTKKYSKQKRLSISENDKKYAFLVITTHGAFETELPEFKSPYDIVTIRSAPIGYANYRIGDPRLCDDRYNNIIKKIKGILRLRKPRTTRSRNISLSLNNITRQLYNETKRTNVIPSELNELNRDYAISHNRRFRVYEHKRGEQILDKYYSYEKNESPSSSNADTKSDNQVALLYLNSEGKVVEDSLNIIMDNNENGLRGFSLKDILKYIKNAYSDPSIRFDKVFAIDMTCSVILDNSKHSTRRSISLRRRANLGISKNM